jgi:hypothetical protein
LSRDEAAAALLSRWTDAEQPSRDDEGAKPIRRSETERAPDEDENQSDDDRSWTLRTRTSRTSKTTRADAPVEASDDALVKLTVDGEEIKIPVKDLKRLYGQEASLTRKSQEVAERRKFAEDEGARYVVATQKLIEKATERFKPYAQIDWAIAAKTLENDEYVALRQEATAAYRNSSSSTTSWKACSRKAKRPAKHSDGGSQGRPGGSPARHSELRRQVYQDMGSFRRLQGHPRGAFAQLTDPAALTHHPHGDELPAGEGTRRDQAQVSADQQAHHDDHPPHGHPLNREGDALKRLKQTGKPTMRWPPSWSAGRLTATNPAPNSNSGLQPQWLSTRPTIP